MYRYWGYYWIRYFVFGLYIRCINESCSVIGSGIVIWYMDRFMVILDCTFVGTGMIALIYRKKVLNE